LHFVHDPGAVDFDGSFADPQLAGDALVRFPRNHKIQNLMLARREKPEALGESAPTGVACA
jgi:hypothetical protein